MLTASINDALADARERYRARHPKSAAAFAEAGRHLPGGSTRSVLYFEPFPLTMARGEGAELWDIDGYRYVDFVGEFSAGLYGHSEPVLRTAITEALAGGVVLAAPTLLEQRLAAAVSTRFPSIEMLRFCNSGTEANLLAIMTGLAHTGRKRIFAFHEGYHGGLLGYSGGGNPLNVPFDAVLGIYNDVAGTRALIREHAHELGALIVEPIIGAGGNIPGTREFLQMLRDETSAAGIVLIFDEVKTSRTGAGGVQGLVGVRPDLTTLGKYLGGGLPSGAFGGRRELMAHYDPNSPHPLKHAGTFNNNVCSMSAGLAGLTQVFTATRAAAFFDECEAFRASLNSAMVERKLPVQFVGLGSMFTVHFASRPINTPADIPASSRRLTQLFHLESVMQGVLFASRGDMFCSLPMTEMHRARLRGALDHFLAKHERLVRETVDGR